jgi:spermidine/putrescine transport system ATP-binding protein
MTTTDASQTVTQPAASGARDVRGATGDLVIDQVTKSFASFTAVDDLSLTVPRGAFFALLGPSGCGKTTTLRMVAGLEQPTSGRVLIGDTDLTGSRPYQRPVNTVFQSYALFPHLDILENVAFGPKRRKEPDAIQRAKDALELVQLSHLAGRKPTQLSGGQQQRVALARAIVNKPEVLLLDEPLGALDLKLRRQMQVELKRIQEEVGLTFIHVTHDQEEAMTMADTVAVMNLGRIEQMGPPAELYELPRTAFVANFLGQSNLARGKVMESRGDLVGIDIAGKRLWVPADRCTCDTPIGSDVVLGVRPEKVSLVRAGEQAPEGANILGPGTIIDASFSGVSTQYLVDVPGLGVLSVFSQNLGINTLARDGDQVSLAWTPAHTFVLSGDEDLSAGVDEDVKEVAQ